MIIFLYGKDDFRSLEKLQKIVTRYKSIHKTGLNLRYFDFQKDGFEGFRDALQTKSMFKEKRFFILKNAFLNLEFKEKFLETKKNFLKSQDVILFYEKEEVSEKDPFFIFLKENSLSQKFDLLEEKKIENWIKKEFEKYKVKIKPEAKRLLIDLVGDNLWQLSNEIKKLVNYKGNRKDIEISKKDIELLINPRIQLSIFETIDFIAKKKKEKAFFLIHKHLEKGDSPLYLLAMINFQFRNLLMIKERLDKGKGLKNLNLHPFVIKKSLPICQKFTLEELKKIYQKIFQIDLDIKTGEIDPQLALDLLIAQL